MAPYLDHAISDAFRRRDFERLVLVVDAVEDTEPNVVSVRIHSKGPVTTHPLALLD